MIPRSKHIAIAVAVAIALLAGLLFAGKATGRMDNIAAVASFATEVIVATSTRAAAPAPSIDETRETMRKALIEEISVTP